MSFIRRFPTSFWVSNFMELFERMAYYGMFNVLVLYLTGPVSEGGLGFTKEATGTMMGIYTNVLYAIPIVGGAMADRYGYKRSFIFSLAALSLAYLLTGCMTSYYAIFGALLLVSVGGGVFKPTLTGTISKTTDEKTSSLGFGIYYMIVNIGGFLGPFVASTLRVHSWKWVFFASALWVGLMLLPALFLYKEPEAPGGPDREELRKHGLGKVLKEMLLVLAHWRFMLLIVIFSGFWIVFFQLFFTMTLYLRDYVDTLPLLVFLKNGASMLHLPWTQALQDRILAVQAGTIRPGEAIPPELITNLDAGCIILFQLLVSRITGGLKPLPSMTGGVFIAGCSMFVAGMTQNPWIVLLSIFILSIGEMSASPRFLEYVGKIAPPDKVALFLGYGFLPISIGTLAAGIMGGRLYGALEAHRIGVMGMWSVFGTIGLCTAAALVLFNIFLARGMAGKEAS